VANILVTGAKGMLGTDLCPILQERGHRVTVTDIQELDVRDWHLVRRTMDQLAPDWVIHLAALTDVDSCEQDPESAFLTNALGTQHMALACQRTGATMIYVSTLSVFDGIKCEPYTEFDTPNPQSWYSRSKYQGELAVEKLLNQYYIVRAGWMFGGGKEDHKFVAQIMRLATERTSLKVVVDRFGSPTYTRDIAAGLERLARTGLYGTYHMVNTGSYCSRFEFAQMILELAEIATCAVYPVSSACFPLPAPRPRMEAARNFQLELRGWNWMRPWREALQEYIEKLAVSYHDIALEVREVSCALR
jgi:dTDP-4-dehydrorhamnose reductase